jgi:hypothetical protein
MARKEFVWGICEKEQSLILAGNSPHTLFMDIFTDSQLERAKRRNSSNVINHILTQRVRKKERERA